MVHSYPLLLSLYKGEGRILIIPLIDHIAGYSIDSDWFINILETDNVIAVGTGVMRAIDYIKESPLSSLTPKEREEIAAWKKNTKYKSKVMFWKNNHYVRIKIMDNNQYIVCSMKKSEKRQGAYSGIIREVVLSASAGVEMLGKAVIDTFAESEMYYANHHVSDKQLSKEIIMLDGSKLEIIPPKDNGLSNCYDCGSAEIYQGYKFLLNDNVNLEADIFLGIAPELDCNLEDKNIADSWQEIYGRSDCFEVKKINYGIFTLCAEMKNKEIHKLSYYMQVSKDLLLECSLEIHQPSNIQKNLCEKIMQLFKIFVLNCKLIS